MLLKRNVLFVRSVVLGVLLALLTVSTLVFPVAAVAQESCAVPAPSSSQSSARPAASKEAVLLPNTMPNLQLSHSQVPLKLEGNSRTLFAASSGTGLNGLSLKDFSSSPQTNLRPILGPRSSLARSDNGQQLAEQPEGKKHGVRKKYLALGILGLVGAAGGAVAVTQSNKYCTTNNISGNGQAQSICSNVHTAGEVMIPVGAVVAGLGFWLAFRHRQ
jgi:hypothetical protein